MTKIVHRAVIHKFPLENEVTVLPWGEVLHVQAQSPGDPMPTVWMRRNPYDLESATDDGSRQTVTIVGTGHEYDEETVGKFHGTAVCANGVFVWHVFVKPGQS
jgi:hypothetical protein